MNRPGPVLEVVGTPAAGKSGLAAALACRVPLAVVKDHGRGDLPALAVGLVRSGPALATAPPPGVPRSRWLAWAARLDAAPAVARRRAAEPGTAVLFDQGPVYTLARMAALRDGRAAAWWTSRRDRCATLLDLMVLLECDTDALVRRLAARRKQHRTDTLDETATRGYLEAERALSREVARALADAGAPVLVLDSGRTGPEEQATAVLAALDPAPVGGAA